MNEEGMVRAESVRSALERAFGMIEPNGNGWRVTSRRGNVFQAYRSGAWLVLATHGTAPSSDPLACVARGQRVPAGVKSVGGSPRAEIPLHEAEWLEADLVRLARRFPDEAPDGGAEDRQGNGDWVGLDVAGACSEAGWEPILRPDGSVAVKLETRRGFYQARLLRAGGETRLFGCLRERGAVEEASMRAEAVMLLRVADAVRLVRPAIQTNGGGLDEVGFEVIIGDPLTPQRIDTALGALSVAACACGSELALIEESGAAERFLSLASAKAGALAEATQQ